MRIELHPGGLMVLAEGCKTGKTPIVRQNMKSYKIENRNVEIYELNLPN